MMNTMHTKANQHRCSHEWMNNDGHMQVIAIEQGKLHGHIVVFATVACWKCGHTMDMEGRL